MRRFLFLSISSYFLVVSFSGCNNPASQKSSAAQVSQGERKVSVVQLLLGDGKNEFRNTNLGSDSKGVLQSEVKEPDENDTGNIYYTFPVDTLQPDSVNEPIDSASYFMVTYNFDKDKLNEIDEDIISPSDSLAGLLLNKLSDYFDSKYGNNVVEKDSKNWNFMKTGKKIRVSLSDESEEYSGKISLVIYSEDY